MIELRSLSKRFEATCAVEEVSFTLARGGFLVLIGGSGSGKTTLLKLINRLIEPSSGDVKLDGVSTSTLSGPVLRRQIGYVPQRIGLFPHLSIEENLSLPMRLAGWDRARVGARVLELLELVELDSAVAARRPDGLSGGQQQRVGVARGLALEPKLMLLDEPFGALDPLTRDRLQDSFTVLRRRLSLTAILVTHDMSEALLLADRIAVFERGRLVQIGTPAELVRHPASEVVEQLLSTPKRQAAVFDGIRSGH